MTGLEMTRLCAKAMGYSQVKRKGDDVHDYRGHSFPIYWPLENDAQAMALFKKFPYEVFCQLDYEFGVLGAKTAHELDLNLAIVECVAKMEKAL